MIRFLVIVFIGLIIPLHAHAQSDGFPGRAIYPMVKIYQTEQLFNSLADVVIVDVRSKFEYDTLHINSAVNIPLNSKTFVQQLLELKKQGKPIVFYCNGHKCFHSYRATLKAKKAGIKNIFAYDSGIFDWTRAYPQRATLMGKTPVNTKLLIGKGKLSKHLLEPKKFLDKVSDKSVILDIREPAQRRLLELFPYRQQNISLSEKDKLSQFLNGLSDGGKKPTLLVYDEGGTQVRWLQYYLEEKGLKNYFFMTGGVKQFFKDIKS